ncbi:tRNA synthetases class II core domain (F)-domain-containing protein, partial [Blyttiomyces helicus]
LRQVDSIVDQTQIDLKLIRETGAHSDANLVKDLKKRKHVATVKSTTFKIAKGGKFTRTVVAESTDINAEMLASGDWKKATFKKYNFDAEGVQPSSGALHPLLKVREEYRQIFLELGFSEMPTNKYVESSFWNFDTLFQPQQHPARDAHDTFFLSDPATTDRFPRDYLERVKKVHSVGGHGSIGYGYDWKEEEAQKLVLRTHTTAVSSNMLYQLAQQFKPVKWFSIDKVFRNETLDATHLAEFHQIEGVVADRGITLGDLKGLLHGFVKKLGMEKLQFKPAYNPYTEPSMEIFAWHDGLNKWVEIGNSGIFRPEMLLPMGIPADVSVMAWGLSTERPTMIKYGYNNIRDLVGHKCDLGMVNKNAICR